MSDLREADTVLRNFLFALQQEFGWYTDIKIVCSDSYLGVHAEISVVGKDQQKVLDRLNHGILNGDNDYRFKSVSHEVWDGKSDYERVKIWAHPDTVHDAKRVAKRTRSLTNAEQE